MGTVFSRPFSLLFPQEKASEILPRLWIGPSDCANPSFYEEYKIEAIISLAPPYTNKPDSKQDTLEISPDSDPFDHLEQIHTFLDLAERQEKTVYICCTDGNDLAPAILASYIMRSRHYTVEECIPLLTEYRRSMRTFSSRCFEKLRDYGKKLGQTRK
jgi:hypothetical protein